MKNQVISIEILHIIQALAEALDLISPTLSGHHNRVAYIASNIALEMELSSSELRDITFAAMLHDSGALTLAQRIDALEFETSETNHAELGYRLLSKWPMLTTAAQIVKLHHTSWQGSETSLIGGHVVHLADRVDVLINHKKFILNQAPDVSAQIEQLSGTKFAPTAVEAFMKLSKRDSFWLDIESVDVKRMNVRFLNKYAPLAYTPSFSDVKDISKLIAQIIDFRSPFTATHSSGVAYSAEALAKLASFSTQDRLSTVIAGFLHDLGKLVVPAEILEKPGPLSKEEFNVMKSHAYYTRRILEAIPGLNIITEWASLHHERLDGTGYPFRRDRNTLPLGAKVLAVADVFTAITEDRPYRKGMAPAQAIKTLKQMTESGKLDNNIVALLVDNFEMINDIRKSAQEVARQEYDSFYNWPV